jgi:hypothetical protein
VGLVSQQPTLREPYWNVPVSSVLDIYSIPDFFYFFQYFSMQQKMRKTMKKLGCSPFAFMGRKLSFLKMLEFKASLYCV